MTFQSSPLSLMHRRVCVCFPNKSLLPEQVSDHVTICINVCPCDHLLCDYPQNTFDRKVLADFRISGLEMIGLNLGGRT